MITYIERVRADVRLVIGDRVLEVGEVIAVESVQAQTLVHSGRASYATPIRALRPDVLAGQRVLSVGEVGYVGEGLAVSLARSGDVELVEPEALSDSARNELALPLPERPEPPVIPEYPTLPVVAKEDGTILGTRVCQRGEKVELPEPSAVEKLHFGIVDLLPKHPLSARGRAYLNALGRRRQGGSDPEY